MPKPVLAFVGEALKVGCLLTIPALIAWITGRPLIFPSLGPSAFALVMDRKQDITAAEILGGHLIGVLCGFLAFHLIAYGFTVSELPASLSVDLMRVAASGVVSVILTTAAMLAARVPHSPACATTMIVSLGLLSTFWDAIFIMLAVTIMYGAHRLFIIIGIQKGEGT
jgi:hypothetical protein